MLYEIGIKYDSDTVKDAQVFIPKVPISINRRKLWYGGRSIPHWNETTDPWVKVPVLQKGTTKIYVDDSAKKDLSDVDTTMIFGDDFRSETALDTNKWISAMAANLGTSGTAANSSITMSNGLLISGGTASNTYPYAAVISKQLSIPDKFYIRSIFKGININESYNMGVSIDSTPEPSGGDASSNGYSFIVGGWGNTHDGIGVGSNANWTNYKGTAQILANQKYIVKDYYDGTNAVVYQPSSAEPTIIGQSYSTTVYTTGFKQITLKIQYQSANNTYNIQTLVFYKYLPTDPKILYIKPYHSWWLFAQQGGIIKEFFAGVFEAITHSKEGKASTNEQITHEAQAQANSEETITQVRTNEASSVENITQAVESVSSTLESISQDITTTVNSLEQVIKEYDFEVSSLEQISNTKENTASTLEEITQTKETVASTEEKIINEYDFIASSLESIGNEVTLSASALEENTQLKETVINTCEQLVNIYEFTASSLESIRNQIESVAGTQESISNQVSSIASVNEQIAYVYEFLGSSVEQIQKSAQSLAGTLEEITQNKVSLASTLEEIEHIVVGAKPFLTKSLRLIDELKANIKLIDESKATIRRM